MVKNSTYKTVSSVNKNYWNELGVNYDLIYETKFVNLDVSFSAEIDKLSLEELTELKNSFFDLKTKEEYDSNEESETDQIQETRIRDFISINLTKENKEIFLLLKDFSLRKKNTVLQFTKFNKQSYENSSILASLWNMYAKSPGTLFEIITLHLWNNRASKDLFSSSREIKISKVLKIVKDKSYRDAITNKLYGASGRSNNYKVYSYCNLDSKIIHFNIYKKVNDKTVPDFEEPIRNREVKPILFSVDLNNKTIEIRECTIMEKKALVEYLENTFNVELKPITKEVFVDYKAENLKHSLLGHANEAKEDEKDKVDSQSLIITSMRFKRSLLPKHPIITFELEREDILTSVKKASEEGIIDLRSLKDIDSMRVKVCGANRKITTIPLESGDVMFTFNDGNMNEETRKTFCESFQKKFGIPLFQPISNTLFDIGEMEKIDYLMTLNVPEKFEDVRTEEIYNELIKEKLLLPHKVTIKYCKECNQEFSEDVTLCEECEIDLLVRSIKSIKVDKQKVKKHVENKLNLFIKLSQEWTKLTNGTISVGKAKHDFFNIINQANDEVIRFMITFEQPNSILINRLRRVLTPTVLIYVGSNGINIEKFNSGCLSSISFGFIYTLDQYNIQKYMEDIQGEFSLRAKNFISESAYEAYVKLKNLESSTKDYDDKQFEDDVYAIINDITLNSVKWGSRHSGKVLPEGAFTLSYSLNGNEKKNHVFTYDCKFSKRDDGYPLEVGEYRKAANYIRKAKDSDFIKEFSSENEGVSVHILISNNLKESKVRSMNRHLENEEKLPVKTVLIELNALNYLFENYRKHIRGIESNKNYFKKFFIELLSDKDLEVITLQEVTTRFGRMLKLKEVKEIDFKEVTFDMLT